MDHVTPRSIKLLVGALLVAAPATLGVGAVSDDVNVPVFGMQTTSEDYDGEVVDTYEKELDAEMATGALDLRIDHGLVKVVGWEQDAYKVEVVQTQTDDDSGQTEVDFQDNTQGDHLNLSVIVDRDEDTGYRVNAGPVDEGEAVVDKAIVAHVPADLEYESINACEGEGSSLSKTFHDTLDRIPGVGDKHEEHDVCVPADDEATSGAHIYIGHHDSSKLNITGGVADLHGASLDIESDDHAVELSQIEFDQARVWVDDGDLSGAGVITDALELKSDNGDVALEGDFGDLTAATDDGDMALTGTAGASEVESDNGEVALEGTFGDLNLTTDDGDVSLSGEAGVTEIHSDNGDLDVHGVSFASLAVDTDDGDVQGDNLTTEGLEVHTDNGRVDLGGQLGDVEATTDDGDVLLAGDVDAGTFDSDNGDIHVVGTMDDAEIATDDGDVTLELTPVQNGKLDIETDNGAVTVAVPEGPAYGYDVLAGTDNGDITIGLNETEDRDDDALADQAGIENSEHERTEGFEDRDIQVHLTATTDDGDIWVVDDETDVSDSEDSSDDEEESGLSSPISSVDSLPEAGLR